MRPSKCPLFKCPSLSAFNCPLTITRSRRVACAPARTAGKLTTASVCCGWIDQRRKQKAEGSLTTDGHECTRIDRAFGVRRRVAAFRRRDMSRRTNLSRQNRMKAEARTYPRTPKQSANGAKKPAARELKKGKQKAEMKKAKAEPGSQRSEVRGRSTRVPRSGSALTRFRDRLKPGLRTLSGCAILSRNDAVGQASRLSLTFNDRIESRFSQPRLRIAELCGIIFGWRQARRLSYGATARSYFNCIVPA